MINKNKTKNYEYLLIKKKYKLSIIIYCFEFKYLNKTIYSILGQTCNYIELIIIYDNYDEIEYIYIKNFTSRYENIKIIKNKENKGLIYSYSIGVLNSNGEYILLLEPGYTLAKENVLLFLYNKAKYYNLDILEFNLLISEHDNINSNGLSLYKCPHFKLDQNLKIIKINQKYKDLEQKKDLLFNKLIKTNIYKKIILEYKLYQCKTIVYNYYEDILLFLLKRYKLKFKHIDKIGVIQNKNIIEHLLLKNITNNQRQLINDSLFYINFLFDNSNNSILDKKYVVQEFINLLSIIYNKFIKITNNSIKLLEKFIDCEFIDKGDKMELQFFYNSLIN